MPSKTTTNESSNTRDKDLHFFDGLRKKIFIVRHGETKGNLANEMQGHLEYSLTEKGKQQVIETSNAIYDMSGNDIVLFSSPLNRAIQTTNLLSRKLQSKNIITIIADELSEIKFGEWEGKKLSEVKKLYPEEWEYRSQHPWSHTPPKGESAKQKNDILFKWLNGLNPNLPETIIFVTHHPLCNILFKLFTGKKIKNPYSEDFQTGSYKKISI